MTRTCEVVAEISNNHNGDLTTALALISAAKVAGADAVKFQCYTPEELIALRGDGPAPAPWGDQGFTMGTLYAKAQTPPAWFPKLIAHCEMLAVPWLSSVFGADSLALLESLACPRYKLAALDFDAEALRDAVRTAGKPLVLSCSSPVRPPTAQPGIALYCPPGYPQPTAMLKNIRNGYDGYSYHGTDPAVPTFAVACGAMMVEVHVQLETAPSIFERNVSLTTAQLAVMVRAIRRAERMMAT